MHLGYTLCQELGRSVQVSWVNLVPFSGMMLVRSYLEFLQIFLQDFYKLSCQDLTRCIDRAAERIEHKIWHILHLYAINPTVGNFIFGPVQAIQHTRHTLIPVTHKHTRHSHTPNIPHIIANIMKLLMVRHIID